MRCTERCVYQKLRQIASPQVSTAFKPLPRPIYFLPRAGGAVRRVVIGFLKPILHLGRAISIQSPPGVDNAVQSATKSRKLNVSVDMDEICNEVAGAFDCEFDGTTEQSIHELDIEKLTAPWVLGAIVVNGFLRKYEI